MKNNRLLQHHVTWLLYQPTGIKLNGYLKDEVKPLFISDGFVTAADRFLKSGQLNSPRVNLFTHQDLSLSLA